MIRMEFLSFHTATAHQQRSFRFAIQELSSKVISISFHLFSPLSHCRVWHFEVQSVKRCNLAKIQ